MNRIIPWCPLVLFLAAMIVSALMIQNAVDYTCLNGDKECHPHQLQIVNLDDNGKIFTSFDELKSRISWSLSVLFFFLAFSISLSCIAYVISKLDLSKPALYGATVIIIPLIIIGYIKTNGRKFDFNTKIFSATDTLVPTSNEVVGAIEVSGMVMLVLLSLAVSYLLKKLEETSRQGMPSLDRAKQIIISRKYLRYLLSSSCVVLVAGVIHSSTLYSWAMSVIEPGNILVTVRQEGMPDITKTMAYYNKESKIPESMAAINGVFYSLLIASIFAPAFMVLRLKSEEAAIEATGEDHPGQVDEWISQNNLKIGLTEKLSTVVTALAPALVGGPALSLFELLFS